MTLASSQNRPRRVAILGTGAWGTSLAILASESGHDVTLVARSPDTARYFADHRRHPTSLPGVAIPGSVHVAVLRDYTFAEADLVVLAVPTQQVRPALEHHAGDVRGKSILSAVKGLELETLLRPSQIVHAAIGADTPVAALSGPNLSAEIAAGQPAATVIASESLELVETCTAVFHSSRFRVYQSDDIVGAELGGALKNIIAIGAGIADGLEAGDNAKAAFMTRGMAEITRLGVACGARAQTFAGLSGIGDLMATCSSRLSRNHRVGMALAGGASLDDVLASMNEVAEGVATAMAACALGRSLQIDLPIVNQMHRILFEGAPVQDAIERLMDRATNVEWPGGARPGGR